MEVEGMAESLTVGAGVDGIVDRGHWLDPDAHGTTRRPRS